MYSSTFYVERKKDFQLNVFFLVYVPHEVFQKNAFFGPLEQPINM